MALWRLVELKQSLDGLRPDHPLLAEWEARRMELETPPDPIDALLAEIERGVLEAEEGEAWAKGDGRIHCVRLPTARPITKLVRHRAPAPDAIGAPASRLHNSCGARPTSSVHGRGSAFRRTIPRRSSVHRCARDCCGSSAERMTILARASPFDEAEHAIHMLEEYRTADELGRAVVDSWRAVDHSLRLLLRSDPEVPDELRLAALSPDELPLERLLNALRHRGLISLELAGSAHELGRAAERARHGDVRAADGDLALRVVARLREEVTAPRPSEPEKEPLVLWRKRRVRSPKRA